MNCLTNIIGKETKLILYYGYFHYLMCYEITVWGGASSMKDSKRYFDDNNIVTT